MNSINSPNFSDLTAELKDKLRKVKLFLCDVDGVLTDGTVMKGKGMDIKRFHVRDGLGLRLLIENGIRVGWISNRPSNATTVRAKELGIEFVIQERGNKIKFAEEILHQTGFVWNDVCYAGDDIVDMGMLRKAALAVTVQDAHPLVKNLCHYTTSKNGGQGAIREISELILHAQGKWENLEILKRGL
ncbi:MAG TPA: HAD hydrolase family protein [Verrucomicrobiota bacterium]|mgnify:CR=1 FL=1|nr:HAD hydrolase family protein [Verrucomicrobiota bacterium]